MVVTTAVIAAALWVFILCGAAGQPWVQSLTGSWSRFAADCLRDEFFPVPDETMSDTQALRQDPGLSACVQIRSSLDDEFFQAYFSHVGAAYVEDESGNVLYAQNENDRMYPASTTKLMTFLLTCQATQNFDDLITVGTLTGCYEEDSVLLYLQEGDQISVYDLLYAMLMVSYNDCATAAAVYVAGDVDSFVSMMNEEASFLSMTQTHFANPHGLYDENHYTTAHDMTQLIKAVGDLDLFREMEQTASRTITIYRSGKPIYLDITNTQYFYTGEYEVPVLTFQGGKTGYVPQSRSNYASVFTSSDSHTCYCTVLSSADSPYMTNILLDYLFDPDDMYRLAEEIPVPYLADWRGDYDYFG